MKNRIKSISKNVSPFNNKTEMPTAQFIIKKCLAYLFCYWTGLLIPEFLVILLHFACGKNPLKGEMFSPDTIMIISYTGYIIPIAVVILYWVRIEKRSLADMGVNRRAVSWLVGGLIGIGLLCISIAAVMLCGGIKINGLFPHPDYLMIAVCFLLFIIQGTMEELFCRGLAFCSLKDKAGKLTAFIVSTVFFILPHLLSMEGGTISVAVSIINLVLICAVLTLTMQIFDSIWAACGLHSLWNFFLACIFGLDLSGGESSVNAIIDAGSVGNDLINGGGYGIESSIVTAAVLAVCTVVMWAIWHRKTTSSCVQHNYQFVQEQTFGTF